MHRRGPVRARHRWHRGSGERCPRRSNPPALRRFSRNWGRLKSGGSHGPRPAGSSVSARSTPAALASSARALGEGVGSGMERSSSFQGGVPPRPSRRNVQSRSSRSARRPRRLLMSCVILECGPLRGIAAMIASAASDGSSCPARAARALADTRSSGAMSVSRSEPGSIQRPSHQRARRRSLMRWIERWSWATAMSCPEAHPGYQARDPLTPARRSVWGRGTRPARRQRLSWSWVTVSPAFAAAASRSVSSSSSSIGAPSRSGVREIIAAAGGSLD